MQLSALYQIYQQYPAIQTDTRNIKKDELFFALKGPHFNGNHFTQQALDAGAAWVIIDEKEFEVPGRTILVEDVLTSLQALARYHRERLQIPVIAITGSNGKTTTKELVHAVLSTRYKTYTTIGNLNNHIGVPLTLLKIQPDAEMAVIEMGANHLLEIQGYCSIAQPTHGLITNCGKAHLEGFGSLEGVRKAKGELFDFLRQRGDGTAFIMADYDYLESMSAGIAHRIRYGTRNADYVGVSTGEDTFLVVQLKGKTTIDIATQLVGDYNLPNVLAAVAIGLTMQIDLSVIKKAIEDYSPSNSRSQLIQKGSNQIILDAYNANPSSMKLAVENLAHLKASQKVLILGAMAEMGAETVQEHAALVALIRQFSWFQVLLVGAPFEGLASSFLYFKDADSAAAWVALHPFKNTTILVKGSRSTRMEKILSTLE